MDGLARWKRNASNSSVKTQSRYCKRIVSSLQTKTQKGVSLASTAHGKLQRAHAYMALGHQNDESQRYRNGIPQSHQGVKQHGVS